MYPSARKEPGCKHYSLLEDRKQAGRFLTFETWTDQAAIEAHMTTPAMKAAGKRKQ
jgi:quinol monooxygenase YgiN